jgi:hypothetical protein
MRTDNPTKYAAFTYCDFGDPNRRDVISSHFTVAAAQRRFRRIARIYSDLHGWRVWQENAASGEVLNAANRG